MTVASTVRKAGPFAGNGAQTSFPFTFKIFTKTDISVVLTTVAGVSTTLVVDSDYTVSINTNQNASPGGSITYPISGVPLPAGSTLTIVGNRPYSQTTQLPAGGAYNAESVESAFDSVVILAQQLLEARERALSLPVAVPAGTSGTLPVPVANQVIGWNQTATGLQNFDPATLSTVVAFGTSNADVFTGNGTQTVYTLTANPGALANLDVSVGGVTQIPTTDYAWISGTTLTFTVAPPAGVPILVRYMQGLSQGVSDSAAATFVQAGSTLTRSVQTELREWVKVTQYPGCDPTGATASTAAIQAAINTGKDVIFPTGTYKAANLTQSTAGQRLIAMGAVTIQKNASGALLTSSGNDVEVNGIGFRGDAVTPTFTGDGIVFSGNNVRIINCGSRWMTGRALKVTGNHAQVVGTCDIFQTTDATATGFDIEVGVSGTATLYHYLAGIYTSQATGGIRFVDTGSAMVIGGQFGKLTIASGTGPAGVNGGNVIGCRILGDINVGLSNSTFTGNTISVVAVTFAAGTSGHSFDASNVIANGATITDNSNASFVADLRNVPFQTYTPVWTAVTTNPTLGNGTITGFYSRMGRQVTATVRLVMGSTTTFGAGAYYVTLPFAASTSIPQHGACVMIDSGVNNYTGVVMPLQDGTARALVFVNASANNVGPTVPFTWGSADELRFTITYST